MSKISPEEESLLRNMVEARMKANAEPLTYKQIADFLVDRGDQRFAGQTGANRAYALIYYDILESQKAGNHPSRFVKVKRGTFFLAELAHILDKNFAPQPVGLARGLASEQRQAAKAVAAAQSVVPEAFRTCGNCHHLKFSGPDQLFQEYGLCQLQDKSHHDHRVPGDVACPCWRRRTVAQQNSDAREKQRLEMVVDLFNRTHRARKRVG